jgi:hypothetical protein
MKVAEEVPEHPLPQAQSTIQEALPMETPIEEPAPADPAGFFLELPVPAMAAVMAMSSPDLGLEYTSAPAVPRRESETWGTELVAAGPVVIEPAISILDSGARATDRRVEMRDFVRGVPVVDVDLPAAQELGLPQAIVEPMQVPAIRYPPQEAVSLWQEPPREFAEYETELGELARAVFTTTGFEEGMNPASPQKAEERPMVAEPAVVAAPEPIPAPPVAPSAQNASLTASTSSVFRPLFSAPNQSAVPPAVEKKPDPVPEPHTKPMPVTLHGVAVGRGKPIQVYMAGVAASVDVQIPRSSALPLRPVMTLGPAPASEKDEAIKVEEKKPAERTVVVKQDGRKPPAARPDPRFANAKVRKAEVRTPEIEAPQMAATVAPPVENAPVERKVDEKKFDQIAKPALETQPAETRAPEAKQETAHTWKPDAPREMPAPLGKPYTSPDLGLPSLTIEPSGGFWSKLPLPGKLGLAALILIVVVGSIYVSTKSSSANAAVGAPRVVESPALPTGDSGWITDWGTEPGVRRQHDISILRSSTSLTDYRLEFQAQIENKALGWVYRAQDGKNYYVSKLEIIKPGLVPTVALIRFAVIHGEEQPRAQFPLAMTVHLDTLYSVRFDAVGDHFTTWVQDQKVDDFTDDRIKTGGVGMYSEHGEKLGLKGSVRVVPLTIKK